MVKNKFLMIVAAVLIAAAGVTNAFADVEVTKLEVHDSNNDKNVGTIPVDVKPGDIPGSFNVRYGSNVNNAQLEVLESGRVVYSDFSTDVKNKSLNYHISGSTPGADYSVRVRTDGVLRVWEYVPVEK